MSCLLPLRHAFDRAKVSAYFMVSASEIPCSSGRRTRPPLLPLPPSLSIYLSLSFYLSGVYERIRSKSRPPIPRRSIYRFSVFLGVWERLSNIYRRTTMPSALWHCSCAKCPSWSLVLLFFLLCFALIGISHYTRQARLGSAWERWVFLWSGARAGYLLVLFEGWVRES